MKKFEYKEQAETPSGTGRTTIDNPARRNYSLRASKGILEVLKDRYCPFCGHHKFLFTNSRLLKCARCKKEIKE